ncbi:hypothetical protein PHLCEN_2v8634 [Hermanssonia centrifuga]|nr:hypothetical protein PHLCEN_2v8634 [Hermanssonia centrifuga]
MSFEPTLALSPSIDRKSDYIDETVEVPESLETTERPPIDYASFSSFTRSLWRRFVSLWTKRFIWSLIAGQVVSLCITCTNVATPELGMRNWALPTTQTWFL